MPTAAKPPSSLQSQRPQERLLRVEGKKPWAQEPPALRGRSKTLPRDRASKESPYSWWQERAAP